MEERLQDQRNREARAERARQEMELRMQAASKKRSKCEFRLFTFGDCTSELGIDIRLFLATVNCL